MAKILVADDEREICQFLEGFLTRRGYEVITARDGVEALSRIESERPHLVILDIRMPKMDGIEVLKKAKELDRSIGVIMLTAISEESVAKKTLEQGADDYITKPFDLEYLDNRS